MTWNDFYARAAILDAVLTRAETDPAAALEFADGTAARQYFDGADGVLLALQYRWSNHLAALLDAAFENGTTGHSVWNDLAARQPSLRAILDTGARQSPRLRAGFAAERRMMNEHLDFQFGSITATAAQTAGGTPPSLACQDDKPLSRPGHRDVAVDRARYAFAELGRVDEDSQVELEPLRQLRSQ